VNSLGATIRVPAGASTRRSDVIDFIYDPDTRNSVANRISAAQESLQTLRSGDSAAPVTPTTTSVDSVLQRLSAGEEVSDEELNSLTVEQLRDLETRIGAQ